MRALVVLDTNALLLPGSDGTDLRDELTAILGAHDWVVPTSVMAELASLAAGDGATARAARLAGQLVERLRMRGAATIEAASLPGDDGLLQVARAAGATVVTNDRRLQGECRRSGLSVVASRGKGRLFRVA